MELLKNYPLTIIEGICGVVFLILGIWLSKFPPKEINNWFRYRTPRSKKSIEHWKIAQTYSGRLTFIFGCALLILSVLPFMTELTDTTQILIALCSIVSGSFLIIIFTERRLLRFSKS